MRYDFSVKQSTTYKYPYENNCFAESLRKKKKGAALEIKVVGLLDATFGQPFCVKAHLDPL